MNYSLSNDDIKKYLGKQCKILRYADLKDISNLDSFMKDFLYLIVLYTWKQNYGHWTVIIKNDYNNTYEFFDSYGTKPDLQLMDVNMYIRNELGMTFPLLAELLHDTPRKIIYNSDKLQSPKKGINTCGKWVVFRCLTYLLPVETFADMFLNNASPNDKQLQKLWVDFIKYQSVLK